MMNDLDLIYFTDLKSIQSFCDVSELFSIATRNQFRVGSHSELFWIHVPGIRLDSSEMVLE